VQRAAAQGQRIDIGNDLAKMQVVLRQLLGLSQNTPLAVKGGFDVPAIHLNEDSLIAVSLKNRTEYDQAVHAKESARLGRESAARENLPVLGVRASLGFKNGLPDNNMPPDINTPRVNWAAGAQVSMPVFDGMKAASRKKEAERNDNAAAAAVLDIGERIRTDIISAKADVGAAFAKLDISKTQVEFAQRSLDLARLKYDAGVITNHDVLDAENDFSQAKLGDLQNRFKYVMSLYTLDQATGKFPAGQ
jgi:outer membrane protein